MEVLLTNSEQDCIQIIFTSHPICQLCSLQLPFIHFIFNREIMERTMGTSVIMYVQMLHPCIGIYIHSQLNSPPEKNLIDVDNLSPGERKIKPTDLRK